MKNRRREKSFENSGRVNCLHLSFFSLFLFYFFFFSYLKKKKERGLAELEDGGGCWVMLLGAAGLPAWPAELQEPPAHTEATVLCALLQHR